MMMISKTKYPDGDDDESEFSHSGRLLEDIEAISRALHLHLDPQHGLISQIKSVNRFSGFSPKSNKVQVRTPQLGGSSHERQRFRNSSRKNIWNWKKSWKSLVRVTYQKIRVAFFLHVHSIEGLPLMFNHGSLSVIWKKQDRISQTLPSLVTQGCAKFDETLALECTVYGRAGALNVAKYEPKISLLNVCVLDEPHLDTGKHWVDLTRVLPVTLDELTGEKGKGSWSTTYPLSGKAKGAALNVSFSYSVHLDDPFDSATNSSEGDARVSNVNSLSSTKHAEGVSYALEDNNSLSVLQKKLDEWDAGSLVSSDVVDFDDLMFTVAQQWMSIADEQNQKPEDDASVVEVIDVSELFSEEDDDRSSQDKPCTATHTSSLDDVSESVTNEFLKLLEVNDEVDDLFPPREQPERRFGGNPEESGSLFLPLNSNLSSDDFDFSSPLKISAPKARTANVVEDIETEELLREWGLSEKSFQKSPRRSLDGFGSPIEIFPDDPVVLPPLGEGVGPFAAVKSGGFLQSMKPSLFAQSQTRSSLIIQASRPVVLPPALGFEFLDIARHLGSASADKLAKLTNLVMPMEDLKGKTLEQVVDAGSSESPSCDDGGFHYVTFQEIIPLMIDKISDLSMEGLRVQSGVSDANPPTTIRPQRIDSGSSLQGNGFSLHVLLCMEGDAELESSCLREDTWGLEEVFTHCVPLEEWVGLDTGVITSDNVHSKRLKSIISALGGRERIEEHGLFESKQAVSLKVQLRDPVRDYEPVGAPMLAVFHLERKYIRRLLLPFSESEDFGIVTDEKGEWCPCFKILETHLCGLRTSPDKTTPLSTRTQHVSGTRWLLANGMAKSNPTTNLRQSQAIVVSRLPMKMDHLWSLSLRSTVKDFSRNPDVILN